VREQHAWGTRLAECAECGTNGPGGRLAVDHIVPLTVIADRFGLLECESDAEFDELWERAAPFILDPANGRLLCSSCNLTKSGSYGPRFEQLSLLGATE